jgi:phosphate transport system ATP-binding protein
MPDAKQSPILEVRDLSVRTRAGLPILQNVSLSVGPCCVHGLIGPSGAGKSTLLKCLNRLIDLDAGLVVDGDIQFRGESIYTPGIDVDSLRSSIAMIFQQPVVFPGSIADNVAFGVKRVHRPSRKQLPEIVEQALLQTALWDEVKDRLKAPASQLSVGQQQRLCLARGLALDPDVILMDEPTSALDPRSTEAIEQLILTLKQDRSIVLVTHDTNQARRVTDWLECLCIIDGCGQVADSACCDAMFDSPSCQAVAEYLQVERSEGARNHSVTADDAPTCC